MGAERCFLLATKQEGKEQRIERLVTTTAPA
jgi:hypothetical protein